MKVSRARVVVLGSFAVLMCVGLFHYAASGQDSSTSAPAEEKVVTRIYNVRDLIRLEQDYPLRSQVKPVTQLLKDPLPGASPLYTPPDQNLCRIVPPKQERISRVMDMIRSIVSPETWRENSGTIGIICEMDGAFVIAQTEANQKQVEALLDQVRRAGVARRTILVQARWVELDGAGLDKLLGGSAGKVPAEVTADAVKDLPIRYRCQITGMDGQELHLAAGRGQTILSKIAPVVSENACGIQPLTEMVQWGATLEFSATLNPDGMTTVDFTSTIAEPGELKPIAMVQHKASSQPAVGLPESLDRLEFNLQSFGGTAKIPLGKPVLIGGSNLAPPGGGPNAKLLYLVLEVSASK